MKMDFAFSSSLFDRLPSIQHARLTGKLWVKSQSGLCWQLYFGLGNLIWTDGGIHPNRAIYRGVKGIAPRLNLGSIRIPDIQNLECFRYGILEFLQQRGELQEEQLRTLVCDKVAEDLFDILQQGCLDRVAYGWEAKSLGALQAMGLKSTQFAMNIVEICNEARLLWSVWEEQGYAPWSPNRAPFLVEREALRQMVAGSTYHNLVQLLDGTRTLRDLSSVMGRDLQRITASLGPYIQSAYVKLVEIQDLNLELAAASGERLVERKLAPQAVARKERLVVCIDDSAQVCKVMGLILTKAGYDYIGIQNPLDSIPVLVERVPDLIFLDLSMPFISGYELCAQIRKISKLKGVPIVILTGNQGIFDRIRVKVLEVAKFITKPFDDANILATTKEVIAAKALSDRSADKDRPRAPSVPLYSS